jgi:Yip1 domain
MSTPTPSPKPEFEFNPISGTAPIVAEPHNEEPEMSLGLRFVNLFVAPSEVFEYLAKSPANPLNWALPLLLNCIAIVAFTMIAFSIPAVMQEAREAQSRQLDKLVADGKITAEQRTQQVEAMEKFSTFVPLFGSLAGAVVMVMFAFVVGALVWLVSNKALGAATEFSKAMEISGLAGLVSVPGTVVKLALVMLRGSLNVGLNPGLLFPDIPGGSPLSTALAGIDFFILWTVVLLAVGTGKITRRGFSATLPWFGGIWFGFMVLVVGWSALTYSK